MATVLNLQFDRLAQESPSSANKSTPADEHGDEPAARWVQGKQEGSWSSVSSSQTLMGQVSRQSNNQHLLQVSFEDGGSQTFFFLCLAHHRSSSGPPSTPRLRFPNVISWMEFKLNVTRRSSWLKGDFVEIILVEMSNSACWSFTSVQTEVTLFIGSGWEVVQTFVVPLMMNIYNFDALLTFFVDPSTSQRLHM